MDINEMLEDKDWYPKTDEEAIAVFRYAEQFFWERTRLERDGKYGTQEILKVNNKFNSILDVFTKTWNKGTYVAFTSEKDPELIALYKYHEIKTNDSVISIKNTDPYDFMFGGSMWSLKDKIAAFEIPEDLVKFVDSCREEDTPNFKGMTRQGLLAYMKKKKFPIDYMRLTDDELLIAVIVCHHAQVGILIDEAPGVRYEELCKDKKINLDELDRDGLIKVCSNELKIELPENCDYSEEKLRKFIMETLKKRI